MKEIACVIVTYNRLSLLKRSVESVRCQSIDCFDIIIINNGSNDGTKVWLDSQKDLIVISQDNLGGAGGFSTGMRFAYNNGYEWLWLMDDDGVAEKDQLKNLLLGSRKYNLKFSNALVCNIEKKDMLSFGLNIGGKVIMNRNDLPKEPILNGINPFNGTFINRVVVERIGFIKTEMFIWGDETEYTYRASKAGYSLNTITNAIHFHPEIKGKMERVIPFWDKYDISVKPERLSHIYYRNLGYIYKTYLPSKMKSPIILYSILFIRKLRLRELFKFYTSFNQGVKGIFK